MIDQQRRELKQHHHPQRVRQRMSAQPGQNFVGDAVLGAVDGGITSFVIVAGTVGGGLSSLVILVLGFASLLADGFSMAVSNFLSTKSRKQRADGLRRQEHAHIRQVPEHQRLELRTLLEESGLKGDDLERAVMGISSNPDLWARMVVQDVYGVSTEDAEPIRAGGATMVAFVLVGAIPLLPFLVPGMSLQFAFALSAGITFLTFFGIGVIKGRIVGGGAFRAGLETLLTGGGAAAIAYGIGYAIRQMAGISGLA